MYGNVIVTGGNSLITGFADRLNHDLAKRCSHVSTRKAPTRH